MLGLLIVTEQHIIVDILLYHDIIVELEMTQYIIHNVGKHKF